jgi:methylthioribose-1-phosphate isomerase
VRAAHPAFDVTPHDLVTAIITENGVVEPPFETNLRRAVRLGPAYRS